MKAPLPPNFEAPFWATKNFRFFVLMTAMGVAVMSVIVFDIGPKLTQVRNAKDHAKKGDPNAFVPPPAGAGGDVKFEGVLQKVKDGTSIDDQEEAYQYLIRYVEQVFARDYTEEKGVLQHVHETMSRFDTVVTYNGASFDLPFIRTRMAVHRLPELPPVGSVDLLHASRRAFREVLPNCRLVTVERHLRGAGRVDDIPSRFIPRAYHEFVRTKDARIMRNVAYHNRMDLFTMAVILNHLSESPIPVTPTPADMPVVDPGAAAPATEPAS